MKQIEELPENFSDYFVIHSQDNRDKKEFTEKVIHLFEKKEPLVMAEGVDLNWVQGKVNRTANENGYEILWCPMFVNPGNPQKSWDPAHFLYKMK